MTWFGETNENGQPILQATGAFDPDTQHPLWALRCLYCLFGYRTAARAAPQRHCRRCRPDAAAPISERGHGEGR